MAATDIKSVLELLRAKVHSADSSTSLDDLNNMVKAAQLAHTPMIRHYDSDGSLPTATTTEQKLAFITSTGSIKMNNGRRWESTTAEAYVPPVVYSFQGSSYGYAMGGWTATLDPSYINVIQKYSFTSDGNATDVADLSHSPGQGAGTTSISHGYSAGGFSPSTNWMNSISKFPFASDDDGTDVGDLTQSKRNLASASTEASGYHSGGQTGPSGYANIIEKYSFTADGNSTDVADLLAGLHSGGGNTSSTHGYHSGGSAAPAGYPYRDRIQKYAFASSSNATSVGDLVNDTFQTDMAENGASSTTDGYQWGDAQRHYHKFPFATDTDSTNVANLNANGSGHVQYASGSSSTTHGYAHGGYPAPYAGETISKFPYAVEEQGTDIGDLAVSLYGAGGTQV